VLALQVELTVHEAFMLAQLTTGFKEPTADLIALNFGPDVDLRGELERNDSVISVEEARMEAAGRLELRLAKQIQI